MKRGTGSSAKRERHPAWVRATHWIGALAFLALMISGTAILLALPRLFLGETGANDATPWITLPLPVNTEQTGWGRNLHFLAAWILVLDGGVYLIAAILGGHLYRRLLPDRDQIGPVALAHEVRDHVPSGGHPAASGDTRYNGLQKLAYLSVICVLTPVMVLSGLTMSPGVTAAHPELFTLFGGRQSARTVHFFAASMLVLFLFVHVWQVLANDPRRLIAGMITGRSRPREESGR